MFVHTLLFEYLRQISHACLTDKWWATGKGPIFFYTGNEGPITEFWEAAGFIFDIAPQFQALVVFAEHVSTTITGLSIIP